MRIDGHQHFWRYRAGDYPWIGAQMQVLRRDWLPEDLHPLLESQGIDRCIAVQARGSEAETDFLLELALHYPWIAGAIGWVDLCAEDLRGRLERWPDDKLLGFRHQIQDEPDAAGFLQDARFRRGVALLQKQARVYEILVFARQLGALAEFCAACDAHWLVLDHLGKPAIRDRGHASWRRDLAPLGAMPHVVCKLSGIVTEAGGKPGALASNELYPYLDTALEIFGPERLMFGSDWPVCLLHASYAQVAQIVEHWAERLSSTERRALWGETAQRVYGLPSVQP